MRDWPEFRNREDRRTLIDPETVEAVLEQEGWTQIITKGDVYRINEPYERVVERLRAAHPDGKEDPPKQEPQPVPGVYGPDQGKE